jgi:hypothetical protein
MYKSKITNFLLVVRLVCVFALILLLLPASAKAVSAVSCQATPGQVVLNEILPAPSNNGIEWVELYNATGSTVNHY